MRGSKLLKVLRSVSTEELRHFRKVLLSPYFTSNTNLLTLYEILRKYHPDFTSTRLTKEKVFEHIFPDHTYSDSKLRNLMSELLTLLEDFLAWETFKKKPMEREKMLMEFFENKNEERYTQLLQQSTKQAHQTTFRHADYYLRAFQLSMRQTEWSASHNRIEEYFYRRKETENLLDNYHALLKAQLRLAEKASQVFDQGKEKSPPAPLFDSKDIRDNLLYQLYTQLELIIGDGDIAQITSFLEKLNRAKAVLEPDTHKELFVALLNYAIGQMQVKEAEFLPLVFELYQFGLSEEVLLENQQMSTTTFLNIVIIGGRMKAMAWTEKFIDKYADYLLAEERNDVLVLGKAYLYFYAQRFFESLDTLLQYTFQNQSQLYPARACILRCYFELYQRDDSYEELLLAQCAAFEKYIRRNRQLSSSRKTSALMFKKMILAIVNASGEKKRNKKAKKNLRAQLDAIPIIDSRKWLEEKIKES